MGVQVERRTQQPGSFLVGLGIPAPRLDSSKTGNFFVWKKHIMGCHEFV